MFTPSNKKVHYVINSHMKLLEAQQEQDALNHLSHFPPSRCIHHIFSATFWAAESRLINADLLHMHACRQTLTHTYTLFGE